MVTVHAIGDGILLAPWRYLNAGHRALSRQAGELLKVFSIPPGPSDISAGYGVRCLDCDVRGVTTIVTRQQNQIGFSEALHVALWLTNSPRHVGKADHFLPGQLQDHLIAHIIGNQTGVALCRIYGVRSPEIGKMDVHLVSPLDKLPPHFGLLSVCFGQLLALFSLSLALFSLSLALFSQLPALFSQSLALLRHLPAQFLQSVNNLAVSNLFTRTIRGPAFEIRFVRFWQDHLDTFWRGDVPAQAV